MKIAIIGRGRVGNALARALKPQAGHDVVSMGRRIDSKNIAHADAVVLAVPDDAIESVAARVATAVRPGASVLHCAGARGTRELEVCRDAGAEVAVMHPFVSFPSKQRPPDLEGTTFVLFGSRAAIATGRRIAHAVGARTIVADTTNPIYHAAAALVANGAAALAFVGVGLLDKVGIRRKDAERAIGGILRTVADNVASVGVPDALTGPVVRGDADTIAQHRRGLRRVSRRALRTYDAVLPAILSTAREAGLPERKAREIRSAMRK